MFWIVVSIILGLITILTLISNAQKSEKIAQLNYTIIYMASNDEDVKKALDEWEIFKG
ncbi:hypothetical protein [Staphylococcus nepalensis]|uniref:hypothetical protein n=1 Tax=Staphylococcus nepalensis TaxID=214473 RepID=UPI003EE5A9B5